MPQVSLQRVRQALALGDFDVSRAHQLLAPTPRAMFRQPARTGTANQSAVLLLLYPGPFDLNLVLIERPHDLTAHAGQIAFPGGRQEPGETLAEAALREAHEEIGIPPSAITLLGELSCIYIPVSDFEVHPFVGWHPTRPAFAANPREVAEMLEAPLSVLLEPSGRVTETWHMKGTDVLVPYFRVGSHKVWGATAIILSEFVERLRAVL